MIKSVDFKSAEKMSVEMLGSKAHALVQLAKLGFNVPSGIILPVPFFEGWITTIQSVPIWMKLVGAVGEELERACEEIKTFARQLEFSHDQEEVLVQLHSKLSEDPGIRYAVRSSSPDEDLEGASFAGGYETSLGVQKDNLTKAIRKSFASLYDSRIILYKRELGIPIIGSRIAVLIQEQIDPRSAGVAFSVNPLNNCYDEALINANFGLGESVVAGLTDPDQFIVDKVNLKILSAVSGQKELAVGLDTHGGVVQIEHRPGGVFSLSQDQVNRVTELTIAVERAQGYPVDIEWAFDEDGLYLLQSRPITTYLPLPEAMITAPGAQKRLYADSTLIEQGVEKPLSVLGTDFMRYVLNTMTGPMGGSADDIEGGVLAAGGRYYLNLSRTLQMVGKAGPLAPGSFGDESVMSILDSIDLDEYLPEKAPPLQMLRQIAGPLKIAPRILPALRGLRDPQYLLDRYEQALPEQLQRIDAAMVEDDLTLDQLARRLTNLLDFFFYEHGLPLVFAPLIAERRIASMFADQADQTKAYLAQLRTALPGNKTAEMGAMMVDLAQSTAIAECETADEFIHSLEDGRLDATFMYEWQAFIDEFGARCPREIDVATPRINEDPRLLYEQLKQLSTHGEMVATGTDVFQRARKKRDQAFGKLMELIEQEGAQKARKLRKLYTTLVSLGGYRETPKHYVIKIIDMFRKRVLEVGHELVNAGRLDELDRVFDLKIVDIDNAMEDESLDLRAIVAERVGLTKKVRQSPHIARIIDSRGKIFFPPHKPADEGELVGVAISPGVVRGQVKVLHAASAKRLEAGEILVARATDPGWTPLFIHAAGVILEIGGALQHGAVVAREYGIPCVSGVDRATDILVDGQLVEIDGSQGVVRVLDGEIPSSWHGSQTYSEEQPASSSNEMDNSKLRRRQTLLKAIPILMLPILLLCLVVGGYSLVQLAAGIGMRKITMQLVQFWNVGKPYLRAITAIIAIPLVLSRIAMVVRKRQASTRRGLENEE